MTESSGSTHELLTQQPTIDDRVCTAYSLVNLAKLMGVNVNSDEISSLANQAVDNGQNTVGLTVDATKQFMDRHGLEYVYLGDELGRNAANQTELMRTFIKKLTEAPISFSISSALTMRASPQTRTGASDSGMASTSHQVLAVKEGGNIRIVDPYTPNSQLYTYPINNMDTMKEFLVLLTSSAGQRKINNTPITRELVKFESRKALNGPDSATFIRGALNMIPIYTARKK